MRKTHSLKRYYSEGKANYSEIAAEDSADYLSSGTGSENSEETVQYNEKINWIANKSKAGQTCYSSRFTVLCQ